MLFNYYINNLIIELKKTSKLIYLYADDIALICKTETHLKKQIKVIENWCEEYKMNINYNKSGIL